MKKKKKKDFFFIQSPAINIIGREPLLTCHVKNVALVAGAMECFVLKNLVRHKTQTIKKTYQINPFVVRVRGFHIIIQSSGKHARGESKSGDKSSSPHGGTGCWKSRLGGKGP